MLEKNQIVWVYDPPCCPFKAFIVDKIDGLNAYRVKLKESDVSNVRTFSESKIFKLPENKQLLIDRIEEDSYYLKQYAEQLKDE
jgi:hypothetical protein